MLGEERTSIRTSGTSLVSQDRTISALQEPPHIGTLRCRWLGAVHCIRSGHPSPEEVEHLSLTTLCEKLIKIGAKVVRHGRYVTIQLAEVAIPTALFAEILRLIDGLRPAPFPP